MKKEITLKYEHLQDWRRDELIPVDIQYKLEALLESAYAPYSRYPVSSVVVMESGRQIVGTNQENAAFPDGVCAERVAILSAKATYPLETIESVYIMTAESVRPPAAPCGTCRQVLHETEMRQSRPYQLYLVNKTNIAYRFSGVQDLLPFSFTLPADLK